MELETPDLMLDIENLDFPYDLSHSYHGSVYPNSMSDGLCCEAVCLGTRSMHHIYS